MNPLEIFTGSDGKATQALYDRLEEFGPVGVVALNLFRAQKASTRAKVYSRRFKGDAYQKKQWSLDNLVKVLEAEADQKSTRYLWRDHSGAVTIRYGWKMDPQQEHYPWVLYVDLPTGQVSFHAPNRGRGPDYPGDWDNSTDSASRIIRWVTQILSTPRERPPTVNDQVHTTTSNQGDSGQTCGVALGVGN